MIHYSAAAKRKARREARRTRARAGDNAARADLSRQARRDALRYMTALELESKAYGRPVAAGRGDGVVLESRELYRKRNGSLAGWALYRWFYRGI